MWVCLRELTLDDVVDGDVMTWSDAREHNVNVIAHVASVLHAVPDR